MIRTIAATLGATLLAVPAIAGGLGDFTAPVVAAPAPAAPLSFGRDWTGGYVGAQIGYGGLDLDGDILGDNDDEAELGDLADLNFEGSGATYGLRSGYDYDLGSAVVGGFLQYDGASIDIDDTDAEIDRIGRAGVRVGYDAGNVLPYLAAGYAYADTDDYGDSNGWFAGAGVEAFVTDNVSVGGEVFYHDFDDFDAEVGGTGIDFDTSATTVGLNVNYRF